ncbi:MAG: hypothetical protein A2086_08205 [Spirochaetes bacterium GWD1_27_9]|nr:MAG: hypothetical protein A2Z98_09045 [Spirochaetes bacterium GWB1_27_13]OHD26426.1 MAG: hypothetical protein A2Y34_13665 [Spirochaetes bacterium GWC1_27_15]OHD34502.1 MAG: hypothetical protein A2086_08205 [Spirochaetes bacterium GWD1_27_9]
MFTKDLVYIFTILEAIEKIFIYSLKFEKADEFYWENDQINFNATVNLLIAIGEEVKKIDNSLKFHYQNIHWKEIGGLRDKITHNYRGIDPTIIWSVIKDELPTLKIALISMLKKIDIENSLIKELINNPYYKHITYLVKNDEKSIN